MKIKNFALLSLFAVLCVAGCKKTTSSAESPKRVFFIAPKDGDTVPATFKVEFGVEGMTLQPAGEAIDDKTSGHHHLLIDYAKGYNDSGEIVLKDDKNIHFGKGESNTLLTLSPGPHKLTLQFADGAHRSYGKELSTSINVIVQAPQSNP